MKNKSFIIISILTIVFMFNACEEFVEKDLSDQWVYGIAPADFITTESSTQVFKWKEVKGAESYNLQIYRTVDSTYQKIQEFIVDTNVRSTQFTYTFRPGYYKWQIYAQNNGGKSGFSIFRFQIDSSADLSKQKVILIYPTNNKKIDSLDMEFTWHPIHSATAYSFQIFPETGNTALVSYIITNATKANYTFTAAGAYRWRVWAMNGTLTSPYTEYKLTIEPPKPPTPVVISPRDDSTTINVSPVQLKWNSVSTATAYKVQISSDSTKIGVEQTVVNAFYNYDKAELKKIYYWRVASVKDNYEGKYSKWWLFRLN